MTRWLLERWRPIGLVVLTAVAIPFVLSVTGVMDLRLRFAPSGTSQQTTTSSTSSTTERSSTSPTSTTKTTQPLNVKRTVEGPEVIDSTAFWDGYGGVLDAVLSVVRREYPAAHQSSVYFFDRNDTLVPGSTYEEVATRAAANGIEPDAVSTSIELRSGLTVELRGQWFDVGSGFGTYRLEVTGPSLVEVSGLESQLKSVQLRPASR